MCTRGVDTSVKKRVSENLFLSTGTLYRYTHTYVITPAGCGLAPRNNYLFIICGRLWEGFSPADSPVDCVAEGRERYRCRPSPRRNPGSNAASASCGDGGRRGATDGLRTTRGYGFFFVRYIHEQTRGFPPSSGRKEAKRRKRKQKRKERYLPTVRAVHLSLLQRPRVWVCPSPCSLGGKWTTRSRLRVGARPVPKTSDNRRATLSTKYFLIKSPLE